MANLYDDQGDGGFRRRRPRPITDYGSSIVQWVSDRRPAYKGIQHYEQERPTLSYVVDFLPPAARQNAAETIPVRHLHTSLGKSKKPVTVVRWMPEGRRLLAGVHNGEFMLWNGMSFNFETVTAMGSSSLRAAEWSNRKDWLVAANDEGTIYYLQTTLNNPHQFKGHDAPIRDLAFSPTDVKFVTASDDNTLKIWDFTSSTNESTFSDHGWDVKACDWHPTKGLIVSGSKDHSVRLWDPRTCRNLTTLHGHKNAITATVFSRLRDQLLLTAGRDGQARVFDLRMMRDVAVLRGHEKGITTATWHPIHPELVCTGGDDGSLHSYLLTEPNTPPGVSTATTSPYSSSDPKSSPAQSMYPAHRMAHAHDSSIWSLDWHPLGHILASGSNDHYTRFWSRAQPGDTKCFRDQFHLGEEGAEAQGTFDRKSGRRQAREQEEQEEEDEAEGLEDQPQAANALSIPGLPLPGLGTAAPSAIPGMGNLPPPPPLPPIPMQGQPLMPPGMGMDPAAFQQLMQQAQQSGTSGPPLDFSKLPLQLPPGFPPPPPQAAQQAQGGGMPGIPGLSGGIPGLGTGGIPGLGPPPGDISGMGASAAAASRRRAPLPSQEQGFKMEQARGNFRVAR